MKLTLGLLILSLTGCSLFKKTSAPETSAHSSEVPQWVYEPLENCDAGELCASGEGHTQSQADANAFKSLASIFETKITATTQSFMQTQGSGAWSQASEAASTSVRDEVNQTLEAARVLKRHKQARMTYTLVGLNKMKASENLEARMNELQAQIAGLWKKKDRLSFFTLWELSLAREQLNDRYNLIQGQRKTYAPDLKTLQLWFKDRSQLSPLSLKSSTDSPGLILEKLKNRLTEVGYTLKTEKQNAHIDLEWIEKPAHLNVQGFEKWSFQLTLKHLAGSDKKGVWTTQVESTGRNKTDALNKILNSLLKQMDEGLSSLHLPD
jgi:hypothetical protein